MPKGGEWRIGPVLPECRFKGFFSLVHASLEFHFFTKLLYSFCHFFNQARQLTCACEKVGVKKGDGRKEQWDFSEMTDFTWASIFIF